MYRNSAATITIPNCHLLRDREVGFKRNNSYTDNLMKKIYASLDAFAPDCAMEKYCGNQSGIFNMEFSKDGRTLIAACEDKSIIMFDTASQRLFAAVTHAHEGCVNGIRFLDNFTFATCSDDHSIRLWDMRHLSFPTRILRGHANWVKSIEYLENEHILISSAFDGVILGWHLNKFTEHGVVCSNLYSMGDLMRTKITNDGTKMVLSSTGGYLLIIHDLNLETLKKDIGFFRPNLYRYLQQRDVKHCSGGLYSYLFSQERTRNRVELIDDFPNQPKVISSLQLHPMGWCAVSRNVNSQESEEWTAVHDIQTRPSDEYEHAYKIVDGFPDDSRYNENAVSGGRWSSMFAQITQNFLPPRSSRINPGPPEHYFIANEVFDPSVIPFEEEDPCRRYKNRIFMNVPRLTNYIQELNDGVGFIKEQSFSYDGRIIASPYGRGLRLLAFNEEVQELAYCIPSFPRPLFSLTELINYHSDCVVSCKFSPVHYQLVSGCLNGEIVWYNPVL